MYVTDLNGNEYPIQVTSTNDAELSGNQSLSCTILPTKVNSLFINDIAEMWQIVDHNGVSHRIVYAKKYGTGNRMTVEVKAVPLFFDSLDNDRIYEEYTGSYTANNYFSLVFSGTNFTFTLVDSFDTQDWEGIGAGDTRLTLFKDGLERYGCEFKIVGNNVSLYKQIGRDTAFMYRYRLNASNIVQENDASAMYTYAKGYGDYGDTSGWETAGLIREYTSPLASIPGIGKRHAPPIKNGTITTAKVMDAQLKTLVEESLKISVSADIHDLRQQGYALAQPELGDRVFLIDERIGLNTEVRIVEISITRDWQGAVMDLSLTFGTPNVSRRYQTSLTTATKQITELMAGVIKLPFAAYDDAVQQATKELQGITSQLTVPPNGGLMAVDKNNSNNVVLFNAAGLGISNDGGQTFKTAITGAGVVAERIVGKSIIGVNLASINDNGYFQVNGSDAEFFDNTTKRSVTISPDGLYGYNSGGDYRFRADSLLVTSRAIGTTTANVYLAAQSGKEARVVDAANVPSDGEINSYTYLALRASGFYGNFVEVNAGVTGNNLYLRPRSGGEVRITGAGTTDAYYPLRAGKLWSNALITTTTSLFLGTDSAVHMVNKTYANTGSGDPIYRDVFASYYYGGAFITSTENAYIGTDGVLKVVNKGMTDIYRAVWAYSFENKSQRELKTDITPFEDDVLPTIASTQLYQYRMKTDKPDSKLQLGVMVEEAPDVILGEDGTTISQYPFTSYLMRGIQQLYARLLELEAKVNGTATT